MLQFVLGQLCYSLSRGNSVIVCSGSVSGTNYNICRRPSLFALVFFKCSISIRLQHFKAEQARTAFVFNILMLNEHLLLEFSQLCYRALAFNIFTFSCSVSICFQILMINQNLPPDWPGWPGWPAWLAVWALPCCTWRRATTFVFSFFRRQIKLLACFQATLNSPQQLIFVTREHRTDIWYANASGQFPSTKLHRSLHAVFWEAWAHYFFPPPLGGYSFSMKLKGSFSFPSSPLLLNSDHRSSRHHTPR